MNTPGYKGSYISSDKSFRDETIENVNHGQNYQAPLKPTFGQKLKNHFRRFWWLHLILFFGGVLIVTLILVYVAFPAIAQSQMDDADFSLISQTVWNPTPDQVYLRMETVTTSKSIYHPQLGAFNASLFLENTEPNIVPFGYITSPATQVLSETHITIDQVFPIANQQQFIEYNTMVFQSETYRVAVRGRPSLHEGAYPTTHVNFNKVVTSKGLNGLRGFKVTDFSISLQPGPDGSNLNGTVYIPNPSPITLTMGTVIQDTYVDGQLIGNTTIQNMTLVPGDNYLPMVGTSDQQAVIGLITSKYKDGILPITVVGNSVIYNNLHIPYYEAAMKSANLTASLDVGKALKAIGLGGILPGSSNSTSSSSSSGSAPQASATLKP